MNSTALPEVKSLRACLLCSLVKTAHQFKLDGCENCEDVLRMRRKQNRVNDCTSNKFSGMVASLNPKRSWVCRWQRIENFVPGMYALRVFGRIPEDVEDELERIGREYIPRDGTDNQFQGLNQDDMD